MFAPLLIAATALFPGPQDARAAAPPATAPGGSIPVKVVAGKLVVSCDLATAANRIPVNLFLEYEGRHGLQLHNRAAASLRAESADGTPRPITIRFPDFSLEVLRRELGDEDAFEAFTKYHSAQMGENALVGSIGVEVFKDWAVTFDLADGEVRLEPPASRESIAADPEGLVSSLFVESDGTVVAPLTLLDDMIWLPVRWNEGAPAGLMLGTSDYDTRIDERAAASAGKPAGDVGPIRIGAINLHDYVAFRPESVVEVHPDLALGITGIGLLECLEVRVDRARRAVRIKPSAAARFPAADLAFFRARATEDAGELRAFLKAHPGARVAHEGARLLLDFTLQDMAPEEEVRGAVQWIFDTMAGDLRTTRMLDLMKEMADAGESGVVVAAGKLGIESGRDDRYPNAVHEVHGLLGRTLFDQGEADEAWRHLLSAAFGLPEDGRINYDLGRFYEGQGRYRRAFSRYVQAVIKPESGGLAIEAMQRVQPLLQVAASERDAGSGGAQEPYSVAMVERMIAGKVRSFGASSPFVRGDETPVLRTVLVEFFTNGHYGNEERGGAIGGALGFEGLIGHFSPESAAESQGADVVFLEYHLPNPRPDALCNGFGSARAATLGVTGPDLILLDGQVGSAGAGKWRDAEEIYNRGRRAAIERLGVLGDHEVQVLLVEQDGQRVSGEVSIFGPEGDHLGVHVVLAEGRVLYPGTSGVVVHRRVARGSLLDEGMSVPFEPDGEEQLLTFGRDLGDIEDDLATHLDQLEADGVGAAPRISMTIDPRELRVVAFLVDERTGAVLAADEGLLSHE